MAKQNWDTNDRKKNKKVYNTESTRQHGYRNFVKSFIRKHKNKRKHMTDMICLAAQQWRTMPLGDRIKYFLLKPDQREKECTCEDCSPSSEKDNHNDHHHHHRHHVPPHIPPAPQMISPFQEVEEDDINERPVSWQRVTNVFLFGIMMLFILITKR